MPWMTSRVEVKLDLEPKASAIFTGPLELSIDCPICVKRRRTVVFKDGGAKCTGSSDGGKHTFPGQILEWNGIYDRPRSGSANGIVYTVGYWYNTFTCAKMGKLSEPGFTWGRLSFLLQCRKCREKPEMFVTKIGTKQMSIQTNLGRPYEVKCCDCGELLMTDKDVYPKFYN